MIPNRQIGWSQEENLLWQISKQLDRMDSILCTGPCPTSSTSTSTSTSSTTTTTTTVCNCRGAVSLTQPYDFYDCLGTHYTCPEVGVCKIPAIVCVDISQPYSGVVPSETVTGYCNCNPV